VPDSEVADEPAGSERVLSYGAGEMSVEKKVVGQQGEEEKVMVASRRKK
jgi:hypothetical protein